MFQPNSPHPERYVLHRPNMLREFHRWTGHTDSLADARAAGQLLADSFGTAVEICERYGYGYALVELLTPASRA